MKSPTDFLRGMVVGGGGAEGGGAGKRGVRGQKWSGGGGAGKRGVRGQEWSGGGGGRYPMLESEDLKIIGLRK